MKYLLMLLLSACVSGDINKEAEYKRNCKELCAPFPVKKGKGCMCDLKKYYEEYEDYVN